MVASNVSRDIGTKEGARSGPDRLESLTGLRWWAAFGIFLAHVNIFLPIPGTNGVFGLGVAGVTFFFVLSGFVLAWTAGERDTVSWFYARRFARIWPLLLLAVVLPLGFALSEADVDRANMVLIAAASLLLIQAWVPGWILEGPNPVTWTLSCEAFFYAVFPFLRRPIARRTLRQLAGLAAVLILVGWVIRIGVWLAYPPTAELTADALSDSGPLVLGTYAPIARLHEFLLGVVVAVALRRGWRCRVSVRAAAALLVAGLVGLWLYRNAAWRSEVPHDAVNQVTAPLFALLIAAVAVRDRNGGRSLLRSRLMVRLGHYSYAFYLFHFIVVLSVASAVFPDRSVVDFFLDPVAPSWGHVGWALLALAVSIVISGLLYRWFEHPMEGRLRRWFKRRLRTESPADVPRQPAPTSQHRG